MNVVSIHQAKANTQSAFAAAKAKMTSPEVKAAAVQGAKYAGLAVGVGVLWGIAVTACIKTATVLS